MDPSTYATMASTPASSTSTIVPNYASDRMTNPNAEVVSPMTDVEIVAQYPDDPLSAATALAFKDNDFVRGFVAFNYQLNIGAPRDFAMGLYNDMVNYGDPFYSMKVGIGSLAFVAANPGSPMSFSISNNIERSLMESWNSFTGSPEGMGKGFGNIAFGIATSVIGGELVTVGGFSGNLKFPKMFSRFDDGYRLLGSNIDDFQNVATKQVVNSKGIPYPSVYLEGYGYVPFPKGPFTPNNSKLLRPAFDSKYRAEFKEWWTGQEHPWPEVPEGSTLQIHHVKHLQFGGDNNFENLVPLIPPSNISPSPVGGGISNLIKMSNYLNFIYEHIGSNLVGTIIDSNNLETAIIMNPGARMEEIVECESGLTQILPTDFKLFLHRFNGGYLYKCDDIYGYKILNTTELIHQNKFQKKEFGEDWDPRIILFCQCIGVQEYLGFRCLNNGITVLTYCQMDLLPECWVDFEQSFDTFMEKLIKEKGREYWL